jgi:hypothetical protein
MAIELTKKNEASDEGEDDRRRAEARATREEFGIETLTDDEELIDNVTFSQIHNRLAMARDDCEAGRLARAAEPASGAPAGMPEEDELLLEEIATELPTQSREALEASRPPADAAEVAVLERMLLAAKDRSEVSELTLRIALHYARVAALFVYSRGLIAGLRGAGQGLEERLEGIMVPADAESMLSAPLEAGRMVRGQPPPQPVDQRLLRAMGREGAKEIAVLPIAIGRRVVNLLYVDNGLEALSDTSLGALRVLCSGVGRVYERLILEAKQANRGGAEQGGAG